ncbi:MAG: phage holin family protein [Hyphomicrobiales bacterium]|nr:phage holin family protein [Hyphomicrobiales bacterium]
MQHDRIANSDILRTLSQVLGDFSYLVQKEIELARAELSEMLAAKLQASTWAIVAVVAALLAAIMVVETAVFALVALGFKPVWACLLVTVILAAGAGIAFLQARRLARRGPGARDLLGQVPQDIHTIKERLT